MKPLARLSLALLGTAGLVGCKDDAPTFVNPGPQAYVRYVNASPDSPIVDARFVDLPENTRTFFGLAFRQNSGFYQAVNAGNRKLRVFLAGSAIDSTSTVVAEGDLNLAERTYYTIVQVGTVGSGLGRTNGNASFVLFTDTIPAVADLAATDFRVRAYNLTSTGPINVEMARTVGTTTLATAQTAQNIPVNGRSPYVNLTRIQAADTLFRFTVRQPGAATALFNVAPSGALDLGAPFTPASIASAPLEPIAGIRQGRSVMSLFVFGPGTGRNATITTGTATLLADQNPPRP
jgi:hypothetical protein